MRKLFKVFAVNFSMLTLFSKVCKSILCKTINISSAAAAALGACRSWAEMPDKVCARVYHSALWLGQPSRWRRRRRTSFRWASYRWQRCEVVNAAWALHRNPLAVVACFTGAGLLCRSCLVVVDGPLCCEAVVCRSCLPACVLHGTA